MKKLTILGSTGSIGKSTLDIVAQHKDQFEVIALTAKSNINELLTQCERFLPRFAVVETAQSADQLRVRLKTAKINTEVLYGFKALSDVAALPEVDFVMAAIVGGAGLLPTLAAAKAGKRILLANKESLVMSGALFMETIKQSNATLLPVDSEHNAIFQCLPEGFVAGQKPVGVDKIILTASGGPFRNLPMANFSTITPEQAVAHPTWQMGAKISVDSATLMNKGLEVIEAHWLFQMSLAEIEVVVHPQSIIHSFVSYEDGSILAQLGSPDMRTPIAYTMSWPERVTTGVKPLNLLEMKQLTFEPVDVSRFPCLGLAYEAIKVGGTASAILNAANEIAVAAFLAKQVPFTAIPDIITETLTRSAIQPATSYEAILAADAEARQIAKEMLLVY